jgi:nucleolar protein 16
VLFSYAALGLVSSLNPSASGGTERELYPPQSILSNTEQRLSEARLSGDRIPKGHGRLIKDGDGNVIDFQLGGEGDETMQQDRDEQIYGLDRTSLDQSLINWAQLGSNNGPSRTDGNSVVRGVFH